MKTPQHIHHSRGFTLIELMIALVLGLFLVAGVLYVFLSNSQTYRTNEALSRVQENGRFAIEFLTSDLRHASYSTGREVCGGDVEFDLEPYEIADQPGQIPELQDRQFRFAIDWDENDPDEKEKIDEFLASFNRGHSANSDSLIGHHYTGNNLWSPALSNKAMALNPISGSDAITVISASNTSGAGSIRISEHNPNNARIEVIAGADLTEIKKQLEENADSSDPQAVILVVLDNDCTAGAAFEVTGIPQNNDRHILHSTSQGQGIVYSNRTNNLGRKFDDGQLVNMTRQSDRISYFIALDATTQEPTLYRQRNNLDPQPMVEGVERMHLLYGERSGNAINYVTADNVSSWDDVVAIRASLLVRSIEQNVVDTAQTIVFPPPPNTAVAINTNDRRLRQVFTTTIALRNRLP